MSKARIKYQNLNKTENVKTDKSPTFYCCEADVEGDGPEGMDKLFRHDSVIFLLNNLLMTVQFFENFDRDVNILRENWYKETSLESSHKRCFHADSLFKLAGFNVKFSPRHGTNKNKESLLHPLRNFVLSENVEAAYDPSALGRTASQLRPYYQLTVKTCEKNKEKSGYISLKKYKTLEPSGDHSGSTEDLSGPLESLSFSESTETNPNSFIRRIKSNYDHRNSRRLTRTEKFIASQNREANFKMLGQRHSLRYVPTLTEDTIPPNGFYNYLETEARLKPQSLRKYRMNVSLESSHRIPNQCFQRQDVKNKSNSRRAGIKKRGSEACFVTEKVLNSAAFKGYFCDLLIKDLAEPLGLDSEAVIEGRVLEESVIVNQKGNQYHLTPVIGIRDWRNHLEFNKKRINRTKPVELEWPTDQMQKVMKILPCYAVPVGCTNLEENLDYEKEWKLVFPKAEEYLLLHMMHAHIRCYLFALATYKTFIEPETNSASFGPDHLMHLLFWAVHRDFLAWPEDRPAETLIKFFKILYRKLQNKCLPDFFVTSRNLFANSHPKDLHMAQSILKSILENPLPHLMKVLRNLNVRINFRPTFDVLKFHAVLTHVDKPIKSKKTEKKEKKQVRFERDEEKLWTQRAIEQIELEKKLEEQEMLNRLSVDSINVQETLRIDPEDDRKFRQIFEMFVTHFTEMGIKGIQNKCLPQALGYLYQIQMLMKFLPGKGVNRQDLAVVNEKINQLKEKCFSLKGKPLANRAQGSSEERKFETQKLIPKIPTNQEGNSNEKVMIAEVKDEPIVIKIVESESERKDDETEEYETRL